MLIIMLMSSLVLVEVVGVNGSEETGTQILSDPLYRLFIGGSRVAKIEEAPFAVALVPSETHINGAQNITLQAFCTGAIILERWVLTAAHCVENYFTERKQFQVIAGCSSEDEFQQILHPSRQIRDPVRVLRHPFYRMDVVSLYLLGLERVAYDVGLIEVNNFLFGTTVNLIQLWSKAWDGVQDSEGYFSTECTVYGWGLKEPDTRSEDLRTGEFTVQHGTSACQCSPDAPGYRDLLNDEMERISLCTASLSFKSLCPGDSGGPLVCNGLLAGVTRSLYSCGRHPNTPKCGGPSLISEWTYVCPMLQWIHWKVPELPDLPASCRSPPSVKTFLVAPALVLVYSIVA